MRATRIGEPARLYQGPAPGSEDWTHAARRYHSTIFDAEVVTNVVVPTVTPVLPEVGCGTAIIIAPGGGHHSLSIDSEGFDLAAWLAERGVAAFVLEYRLVPSGDDAVAELVEKLTTDPELAQRHMAEVAPLGAADAEAAVGFVRDNARRYSIAPDRVGVVGFSAGGNVALRLLHTRDAATRPDFAALIYTPVRGVRPDPPEGSGPLFIAVANDDQLGVTPDSLRIFESWREAGLSAELHVYAHGGHGFGMRHQELPSDGWVDRLGDWLRAGGWLEDPA